MGVLVSERSERSTSSNKVNKKSTSKKYFFIDFIYKRMIDKLPKEIFFLTLEYLNRKDILHLGETNKHSNLLCKNNAVWKYKCKVDYNKTTLPSQGCFSYYKLLYNHLCLGCQKQTIERDHFYNHLVCKSCQKSHPKYATLCKNDLKLDFCLKDSEIKNIEHKTLIRNKKPYMYVFLRSNVINYIRKSNLYSVISYRHNKRLNKRINDIIICTFRYNLLKDILQDALGILIEEYPEIHTYCPFVYKKYIKKYKPRSDNNTLITELIYAYIELRYLKENGLYIEDMTRNNLNRVLLYDLLTSNETRSFNCNYINTLKLKIINDNIDKFLRKFSLERWYSTNNLRFNIEDLQTWFFIYYGGSLNTVYN